jgi:thymidylate synthase
MQKSLFDNPAYIKVDGADAAYAQTLSNLLTHGLSVIAGNSLSTGSGKNTREILNYSVIISDLRNKLVFNRARRINLPGAIARFVWMMAASDRLADIAFYEPKVKFFSDDGISVPGSSYGQRILRARPGLNQFEGAIKRLKEDSSSRRAAISIYHPEDITRESKDIPCTFGLFYHIRENKLHATTVMRSNNAFILMPYNIFEFSLLAEVLASELEIEVGSLTHNTISMHLYENNIEDAKKVVNEFNSKKINLVETLPKINTGSKPLEEIRKLVILEAEIRHASAGISGSNIEQWISKGEQQLNDYWRQFYYLLLFHVVKDQSIPSSQSSIAIESLESVIDEPWKSYLPSDAFQVDDYSGANLSNVVPFQLNNGISDAEAIDLRQTRSSRELETVLEKYELESSDVISWKDFSSLQKRFGDRVAARNGKAIGLEDIKQALQDIRA